MTSIVARLFPRKTLPRSRRRWASSSSRTLPFIRRELPKKEARAFFEEKGEPYKVEIIDDLGDDVSMVSLYEQGTFTDLCRGPHVPSTGFLKAFKLLSVAGAYWRGDEHNKMLQRIYGTAFGSEKELKAVPELSGRGARSATTASSARSSSCSCSRTTWARAWSSICPRAAGSGRCSKISKRRSISRGATTSSTARPSCAARCGKPQATWTIIKRTCISPRWTTSSTASSP